MNKKSLSTLEFYKITDQLVSYACCDGAKKILRNLKPMTDITDINLRLDETNDALSRIFQKGTVDFSQTKDIRASVARLKVGSSLNISFHVPSMLRITMNIVRILYQECLKTLQLLMLSIPRLRNVLSLKMR